MFTSQLAIAAWLLTASPVGLGIETEVIDDRVVIQKVFVGGGADNAGIRQGSVLLTVDGVKANTASLPEIIKRSFGSVGSPVGVVVIPPTGGTAQYLTITRREYNVGRENLASQLIHAVQRKKETVALKLLEAGASVNVTDPATGKTPLMYAAFYSMPHLLEALLMKGADVDIRDKKERTALLWAAGYGKQENIVDHRKCIRLLLKAGANVNVKGIDGWTPLMQESMEGDAEIVGVFLAGGAVREVVNNAGDSAATIARNHGHGAVLELLNPK